MSAQILQFPRKPTRAEALLDDWRKRVRAEYPDYDDEEVESLALRCSDIERIKLREDEQRLAVDPQKQALLAKARAAIAQLPRRDG